MAPATSATARGRQVADRHLGPGHGGDGKGRIQRVVAAVLPEWQVFIRRPDGRSDHFTLTRRHQTALLASVAAVSLWAVAATTLLAHQPEALAAKERQLEELMASYHAAQHRLTAAHKMVGDITREIDEVHSNLLVLAESNATLAKDRPGAAEPAEPVSKVHIASDPAYDDHAQPGGPEAKAVREDVHKLEASLDRLKVTYSKVVRYTADVAGQRIAEAQRSLQHLGLDPDRLTAGTSKGQGGPFVPAPGSAAADPGLDHLIERMQRWDGMKVAMQKVPLVAPLHAHWELNSPFGARNDPLNQRSGIHEGIDMGATYGTPVYATGSGIVRLAAPYDRYGNTIDIDHGNGLMTRYAHLSKIKVQVGQKVTRSTVIGLLGNSGRSTGAHLHYEVRVADTPRDPLRFISAGRDAPKAR